MRKLAIGLVALLAAALLYRLIVVPWHCNQVSKVMEAALQAALGGNPVARAFLSDHLDRAEACRALVPDDANLNVAIASTYAMLDRHDEALRVYELALQYDRRPEMYFNRAVIRLGTNDIDGAIDDFVYAARFNSELVEQIHSDAIRERVVWELTRVRAEEKP